MNRRNVFLKVSIGGVLGICFFMLHTMLTYILHPEGIWVFFLIFAFGFIYQGVEYFFTIPDSPEKPARIDRLTFFISTVMPPLMFSTMMKMKFMRLEELKSEITSTQICILVIIAYKVFRFLIAVYRAMSDMDE